MKKICKSKFNLYTLPIGWLVGIIIALTSCVGSGTNNINNTVTPITVLSNNCTTIQNNPLFVNCEYESSATTYPNYEGGPWIHLNIMNVSVKTLDQTYESGFRIIHSYICLSQESSGSSCPSNYVPAPLTQQFLEQLESGLNNVRSAGLKVILRFAYNLPASRPAGESLPIPNDAPMPTIIEHLNQLAPIVLANKDIIYTLQAGFIGLWGEWHNSTNGNDTPEAHQQFFNTFLPLFKNQINLEARYPADILQYMKSEGLSQESPILGIHDDYYTSSSNEAGTFNSPYYTESELRSFAMLSGTNFTFTGETSALYPALQNCESIMTYSQQYHLSSLDVGFESYVINYWKQEGCYDNLVSKVGSRIYITKANISFSPDKSSINLELILRNDGFASIISKRKAYLRLENNTNGLIIDQLLTPIELNNLAPGTSKTWDLTINLGASLPQGSYKITLWLPDVDPQLQNDPRYSFLLNNIGMVDMEKGENILIIFNIN